MDTFYLGEKFESFKKYLKYLLILIPLLIAFFAFRSCGGSNYGQIEKKVENLAIKYVRENSIVIYGEQYIELSLLEEIPGTELCSKASGAIVKNNNGSLEAEAYLSCGDYQSSIIKNKSKYAKLNGEPVILLNVGEVFNDPSYEILKECNVEVDGYVGSSAGVYKISYLIYVNGGLVDTLYRLVIVSRVDHTLTISGNQSTDTPTITLEGDKEIVIYKNQKFSEPGYTAVDYTDGKISRKVQVEPKASKIDTSKTGTYIIVYSVTNSKGNTAVATRKVTVVDRVADINISLEKVDTEITNEVKLRITIGGRDYSYMNLPNSSTPIYSSTYEYPAKYNGSYTFKVYDRYGNVYTKTIEVDNIDSVAPTGTCKAVVTSSATTVEVEASDDKGISGYNYIFDGKENGYVTSNQYQFSDQAVTVSVKVKDIAGNVGLLKCEIEDKSSIISGACGPTNVTVTVRECFDGKIIRSNIPLEEYVAGVLFGEENPSMSDDEDYIKAFIIFARTFTLNKIGYFDGKNKPIQTCSNNQNWCDINSGCYRDQTQEIFDACIDYAISYSRHDYTALTCANRVTTFPGSANVQNKTFYVNNPAWWGDQSVTSTGVRSSWKKKPSAEYRAFLERMVAETAGLVMMNDGESAGVGYYICDNRTAGRVMCPNIAKQLANEGYTMEEILKAYTKDYPNLTVECFNQ